MAARHERGAVASTFLAARHASADKKDALLLQFVHTTHRVGELGVATVNNNVALVQVRYLVYVCGRGCCTGERLRCGGCYSRLLHKPTSAPTCVVPRFFLITGSLHMYLLHAPTCVEHRCFSLYILPRRSLSPLIRLRHAVLPRFTVGKERSHCAVATRGVGYSNLFASFHAERTTWSIKASTTGPAFTNIMTRRGLLRLATISSIEWAPMTLVPASGCVRHRTRARSKTRNRHGCDAVCVLRVNGRLRL